MKHHKKSDAASGAHHNGEFKQRRLIQFMTEADISGRTLASSVNVHPNTVANWRNGKTEVPGAVLAYLELLANVRKLLP